MDVKLTSTRQIDNEYVVYSIATRYVDSRNNNYIYIL